MSLRCADLLDQGVTDVEAARILAGEFKTAVKARAVAAFRKEDYAPIAEDRLRRQEDANRIRLILGAARDAGATFAQQGTDLLAKMMLDTIQGGQDFDPVAVGKLLAKFQELEIQKIKAETDRDRAAAAARIRDVAGDKSLTKEQLVDKVDEILQLKKPS